MSAKEFVDVFPKNPLFFMVHIGEEGQGVKVGSKISVIYADGKTKCLDEDLQYGPMESNIKMFKVFGEVEYIQITQNIDGNSIDTFIPTRSSTEHFDYLVKLWAKPWIKTAANVTVGVAIGYALFKIFG